MRSWREAPSLASVNERDVCFLHAPTFAAAVSTLRVPSTAGFTTVSTSLPARGQPGGFGGAVCSAVLPHCVVGSRETLPSLPSARTQDVRGGHVDHVFAARNRIVPALVGAQIALDELNARAELAQVLRLRRWGEE